MCIFKESQNLPTSISLRPTFRASLFCMLQQRQKYRPTTAKTKTTLATTGKIMTARESITQTHTHTHIKTSIASQSIKDFTPWLTKEQTKSTKSKSDQLTDAGLINKICVILVLIISSTHNAWRIPSSWQPHSTLSWNSTGPTRTDRLELATRRTERQPHWH